MNYVKVILSGLAALFIAEIVCSWSIFSPDGSKATGLAVVAAMTVENLLSPIFWMVAALSFGLFFVASRATTPWRVLFFWIPTVTVSVLGFGFVGMCAYLIMRVRHQFPH